MHEQSWGELVDEIQRIRKSGPPLRADWFAIEDREQYGIWVFGFDGVGTDGSVADFTLFAARVIEKLRIQPSPLPKPSDHDPQWPDYLRIEEEGARLQGKTVDLSDAVPYGLGEVDSDAVDPCTRAWLDELRRNGIGFQLSEGTSWLKGQKSRNFHAEICDVYEASSIYCTRRARDEIARRLQTRAGEVEEKAKDKVDSTIATGLPMVSLQLREDGPPNGQENPNRVRPVARLGGQASSSLAKNSQTWFRSGETVVALRKSSGMFLSGLAAYLSPQAILVSDASAPIEAGDTLIRTLPSGLQIGFIVDDPGFSEGLGSIPPRFEVKAHRAAPIDTRESSDFWRRLRNEFEQLSGLQRAELGIDRNHRRWLIGACSHLDEEGGEVTICSIKGGLNSEFVGRLEEVATQAAIALGSPSGARPVDFWLSCLCLDILQNPHAGSSRELWQSTRGGGIINDLLTSSVAYCSRLAALADRNANRGRETTTDLPAPQERTVEVLVSQVPTTTAYVQPDIANTEALPTELNAGQRAQQTRAATVAKLILELNRLKPQMFEDEAEYEKLRSQYPGFLAFKLAENRPDLKQKLLAIRGSTRHIRLAQELAAEHHGRQLSTIKEDWKNFKPADFRRPN